MLTDDLPWPELGNVSRGATRGNQGQKGVLGPPDAEGRSMLQLRVQPGVLAVRLNRQASDWYRMLDDEVNRALKLTKTYWRKARRRQDYDARADQDHMELHEWLQQLKDKVMSHLELLMQKGEIQGPPYVMHDHVELTFLRKFVERQAAGIPHNPRLRRTYLHTSSSGVEQQQFPSHTSAGTSTPLSITAWDAADNRDDIEHASSSLSVAMPLNDINTFLRDVESSKADLDNARSELARVQRETKDAFARYSTCLDTEERARQRVMLAEQRRDALTARLMQMYRNEYIEDAPARSPAGTRGRAGQSQHRAHSRTSTNDSQEETMSPIPNNMLVQDNGNDWRNMRGMPWPVDSMGGHEVAHANDMNLLERSMAAPARDHDMQLSHLNPERKHTRTWDQLQQTRDEFEEMSVLPPLKRHQLSPATLNASTNPLTSSMRRSAMPSTIAADPRRMDQNVAILLNAQSASHLGNVPL